MLLGGENTLTHSCSKGIGFVYTQLLWTFDKCLSQNCQDAGGANFAYDVNSFVKNCSSQWQSSACNCSEICNVYQKHQYQKYMYHIWMQSQSQQSVYLKPLTMEYAYSLLLKVGEKMLVGVQNTCSCAISNTSLLLFLSVFWQVHYCSQNKFTTYGPFSNNHLYHIVCLFIWLVHVDTHLGPDGTRPNKKYSSQAKKAI